MGNNCDGYSLNFMLQKAKNFEQAKGIFNTFTMKVIINSLGFMLVGLGISCIVPTLYSFVGAKSKTPVSIALTILSSISFIGLLIAPLLIGAISQAFDIRIAYMLIGILGGCIVLIVSFSSAFDIQESGDIFCYVRLPAHTGLLIPGKEKGRKCFHLQPCSCRHIAAGMKKARLMPGLM